MRYRNEPYWLTAKYTGKCVRCHGSVNKGERAFYYPSSRTIYCKPCGELAESEFAALAADEAFYNAN